MNKEIINVLLAADNNYAQPLGVTLYSMMNNFFSEKYQLEITVLDGGIAEENRKKLYQIADTFATKINFVKMSDENFKDFPIIFHFSVAIYYRLLIPNLFAENVEKVLYLDCDILILGNVAELYETNIDTFYLAAVKDFIGDGQVSQARASFYKKIIKMFNSGVLLMNLKKMRQDHFVQKTLEFIKDHSDELKLPDQEALNYVSASAWLELDKVWNFQIDRSQEKIEPRPNVLHYTNSYKPWHAFYNNYYQKDYMNYMKQAWPDYKIKLVPFSVAIKQILKYIPFSVLTVRTIKKILRKTS